MNRTIKFRVWNEKRKEFDFSSREYFLTLDGRVHYWSADNVLIESKKPAHEMYKIQQFTGLLDKNGKEIFEGDILSFGNNQKLTLMFGEFQNKETGIFGLGFYTIEILDNQDNHIAPMYSGEYYSVIGNIFENPELLK